ncbi:MAG: tetratricopeptide repeat protein [Lachnospiraceae bacterium]|nr:tetratricopeptide repeat protein [Lachnospiraceae bacterium]
MKLQKIKIDGMLAAGILLAGMAAGCGNSKNKEDQEAYRQIGINNLEQGKYDDAVDAFQKALDQSLATIGAEELDICYYKAQAQYMAGDTKGALETYTALIDYDKKNADAYYLRGSLYLLEGEDKKALADYASAVENDDANYDLYIQAYSDLTDAGFSDEAKQYLEDAVQVSGKDAQDYAMRGKAYALLGEYDKAAEQLDKAVELKSDDAILYRAQVYEAAGDSDKAQSLYEEYVKTNEDNPAALGSLGSMLLEAGKYEDALNYIQTALASEDVEDEQNLRRNEILAYEYKGDFSSAKEKMASYVEDYPEDETAAREYQFLQTR